MNIHYLVRLMLGKATCSKASTSSLHATARIINMSGSSGLIKIAAHSVVKGELLVFPHGGRIAIGEWCFVGQYSKIWSGADISIGNRVLISHNVNIIDSLTHPLEPTARHEHFRQILESGHPAAIKLDDQPIRIEDDVWIGTGAIILRGVSLGFGAIVGAGSVVTQSVPPLTIVAGNPARAIRRIGVAPAVIAGAVDNRLRQS